jgi:cell division protein FtsA
MPVRLGFPVGVKGIVQLVQGPQYATGVGLVRYGAQQLADAYGRAEAARPDEPMRDREDALELGIDARRNGFWSWLRAAF